MESERSPGRRHLLSGEVGGEPRDCSHPSWDDSEAGASAVSQKEQESHMSVPGAFLRREADRRMTRAARRRKEARPHRPGPPAKQRLPPSCSGRLAKSDVLPPQPALTRSPPWKERCQRTEDQSPPMRKGSRPITRGCKENSPILGPEQAGLTLRRLRLLGAGPEASSSSGPNSRDVFAPLDTLTESETFQHSTQVGCP